MKALKKSLLAVAATTLLSIGTSAQAGVIIDLFEGLESDNTIQEVKTSTLGATVYDQVGARPNVIGAYRDISVAKTFDSSANNPNTGESALSIGDNTLSLSNAQGNKSVGLITWDGVSKVADNLLNPSTDYDDGVHTIGLGGVDLTFGGATAIEAAVRSADLGFDYTIRVWDIFGNKSSLIASVLFAVVPADGITADYQYIWFNQASGDYVAPSPFGPFNYTIVNEGIVDFTKIGALQLELRTAPDQQGAIDLELGLVRTIPEPGTLALVGAALFGVAAVGRRRKA
jgi:hypothetical protein